MTEFGQQFCAECLFREYVNSPITIGEIQGDAEAAPIEASDGVEAALTAIPIASHNVVTQFGRTTGIPAAAQEEHPASAAPVDAPEVRVVADEQKATQSSKPPDSTDWPEPKRIHATLPSVPEFDPELLPGAFRDFAVDLADRMQVPLDFPAAALTVALGSVVGRRASITPKENDRSWGVVPNLWGGIVARPGSLKSPAVKEVFRPLKSLEVAAIAQHKAEIEEYEKELEGWEMRKKKAYGPKGGGVFDEPKPERPPGTRYLLNDATIEKLHAIHIDNPQGVFLNRDELAGFLATLDTKGRERDRPFFLEGWNGDSSYTIDRIGRGTLFVPHLCISLFGGIQPAKLQSYLSGAVVGGGDDDGLAQRLQIIVWPDQGAKYQNVDRPEDESAAQAVDNIFRRLSQMSVEDPFRARFDPEAQEMFNAWREELENRVRNGKLPRHMESHLAKYRSLMPSLALLLHLAEGSTVPVVPLVQAQRAADWCVYLEEHAKRVYSCVTSIADRAAATLAERIKKGLLGKTFTAHDIYLKGWANLTKTDSIMLALGVLQDAGWVRVIPRPLGIKGGRPTEDYIVNPAVFHE
jgi:putative DNA primase/helicase